MQPCLTTTHLPYLVYKHNGNGTHYSIELIIMHSFFTYPEGFRSAVACCQFVVIICKPNAINRLGSTLEVSWSYFRHIT